MTKSTFTYVTYIRTTPAKLWQALTDADFTTQYWFGMRSESAFTKGAPWRLVDGDGKVWDDGEVLEAAPPRRLVLRWHHRNKPDLAAEGASRCTMEIEPAGSAVKLSITHSIERDDSKVIEAVSGGWPKVVSNLKSLLESGATAMDEAYPAERAG